MIIFFSGVYLEDDFMIVLINMINVLDYDKIFVLLVLLFIMGFWFL